MHLGITRCGRGSDPHPRRHHIQIELRRPRHPVESGCGDGANYRALARLGYDDAGRNTWSASSLGIVTTWRFDTEGQLLERLNLSNTIKQTQRYDYDQSGHLRAVTDAAGGTRRIDWNALGLPDALTDTLGRTMRFGYDAAGNITTVTDTVDAATHFEVDVYGRSTAVVAPNGATTRYLRDDFGRIVATIGADSGKTTRRFDAADRWSPALMRTATGQAMNTT